VVFTAGSYRGLAVERRRVPIEPLAAKATEIGHPTPNIRARAALAAQRDAIDAMIRVMQLLHSDDHLVESRRHLDPRLLEQILAVDEQVAAAGQGREVNLVLEGRDLLPARIKIGEVVFLRIVIKQRRDPIGLREQSDVGLVDVIDVVFADGRGVCAGLGAAIVLIEIVDVERRA
jgi:hypothetical protein